MTVFESGLANILGVCRLPGLNVLVVVVVVVYHVTIVALGHGVLKRAVVIGCVLRAVGSSII